MSKKSKVLRNRIRKRVFSAVMVLTVILVVLVGALLGINRIFAGKIRDYAITFPEVCFDETRLSAPELDIDGYWSFSSNNGIKIMQITDLHLRGSVFYAGRDKAVLNAVASMVNEEKPDLVIATGDIVQATVVSSGSIDNLSVFKSFCLLMETLSVYWTFTFGNHDTEAGTYYSREDLCNYIQEAGFSYCLFQRGPLNVYGYGNSVIKVKNSEGVITQAIITIDSNDYAKRGQWTYDHIHDDQILWYKNTVEQLNEQNRLALEICDIANVSAVPENYLIIPSLLFFHIPLMEYDDAWREYENNGFYNTENVRYYYGDKLEKVCYAPGEDNMFETILQLGSTKGIFCGHDHSNDFSVEYKGVRLVYSKSIKYSSLNPLFNKGYQRGCTIIKTEDSGEWTSQAESFYQDKYVTFYPKDEAQMEI